MKLPRITTEKLSFVGPFSSIAQRRIRCLTQRFCKNLDIKWCLLPSYKIKNSFSVKDAIPKTVRSRVVYKFSCAGCNACYVGETNRHLATRGREHLTSNKNSVAYFPAINGSNTCKALCSTAEAGGVRHEIRPIRMRYLINSFREHEQQSGELSLFKISSLTKSVVYFGTRNHFEVRRTN